MVLSFLVALAVEFKIFPANYGFETSHKIILPQKILLTALLSGMGFSIKKIIVHKEPTPVSGDLIHYNMFRSNWDARELLEVFSRQKSHRDYCLAHLFTDVAFEGGILGLAYVGSHREGSVGGRMVNGKFRNNLSIHYRGAW